MHRSLPLALLVATTMLSPASSVRAQDCETSDVTPCGSATAEYRFWLSSLDDFEVAAAGTSYDSDLRGLHRLRLGGFYASAIGLDTELEGDLLADNLFGSVAPLGQPVLERDIREDLPFYRANFIARAANLRWRSDLGELRAGLMTSAWGLGILANDGRDWDDFWGSRTRGDSVVRLAFATRPFQPLTGADGIGGDIVAAIAGDVVYADGNAELLEGDRAYQVVGALFYRTEPHDLGAYVVYRSQHDDDGAAVRVTAIDGFGRVDGRLGESVSGGLAGEVAFLTGETTRIQPEESPRQADVAAVGAAVEGRLAFWERRVEIGLRSGYASGDANLDDDTVYRFRFNPDYNVGLVLFDHYLPAVSRAGVQRAADEDRIAVPARGLDQVAQNGGIENAVYVAPSVLIRPVDGLELGTLVLFAASARGLADPFFTFEAGGAARGPFGGDADPGDSLGVEVDAGLRYRWDLDWLAPDLRIQYGHLRPGAAFADAAGERPEPIHLVELRLGLRANASR